jgi:hypothetical protein
MKNYFLTAMLLLLTASNFAQDGPLSSTERTSILYMREEEKLARDVYDSLFKIWNMNPFSNIRRSEQVHMDRMKTLLVGYRLEDPVIKTSDRSGFFINQELRQFYNESVTSGSQSFINALKVGAKIEEQDIADLEKGISNTKRQDIISTYQYLKMASENHLRAFYRRMRMSGVQYEPVILQKQVFEKIVLETNPPARVNRRGSNL